MSWSVVHDLEIVVAMLFVDSIRFSFCGGRAWEVFQNKKKVETVLTFFEYSRFVQ